MTRVGTKDAAPRDRRRDGLAPLSAKGGGTLTSGAAGCIVGLVEDKGQVDHNATPQLAYHPPSIVVTRQYFAEK